MDLLQRKFSAQSVALATGATAKQITDWCNQGQIVGQREPLGKGHKREFSFFNVMEVAVARALMETGVTSPGDAFRAAQRFSHTGNGGADWIGDDALQDNAPVRYPGLPFHYTHGETFVYVAGAKCSITLDDSITSVMRSLGRPAGFLALNLSAIFAATMARMALNHAEVLDAIYGGASD